MNACDVVDISSKGTLQHSSTKRGCDCSVLLVERILSPLTQKFSINKNSLVQPGPRLFLTFSDACVELPVECKEGELSRGLLSSN